MLLGDVDAVVDAGVDVEAPEAAIDAGVEVDPGSGIDVAHPANARVTTLSPAAYRPMARTPTR